MLLCVEECHVPATKALYGFAAVVYPFSLITSNGKVGGRGEGRRNVGGRGGGRWWECGKEGGLLSQQDGGEWWDEEATVLRS